MDRKAATLPSLFGSRGPGLQDVQVQAIADGLIAFAYLSIFTALLVVVRRRREVRFPVLVWLLLLFILLGGLTHLANAATFWGPHPGPDILIKATTALVSVAIALVLWPLVPRIVSQPSREALHDRIAERDKAVAELQAAMGAMVEMREHERRQRLLLDELNHRVKNTLASVQSIAMQTLRSSPNMDDFQPIFLSRLMSLSSTHDVLVRREWRSARFSELIASTLDHYGCPYEVTGPDLWLSPNTALTLGLALHELSTNAIKHGAWSAGGKVDISTAFNPDGRAFIAWRESGGPPVTPPTRYGFGSRLLQTGVSRDLGGDVELDFRPEGLVCSIRTAPDTDRIRLVEPDAAGAFDLHNA
jgi:two-component sensor histidine kinase